MDDPQTVNDFDAESSSVGAFMRHDPPDSFDTQPSYRPHCPKCRSEHVELRRLARRAGGAIGAAAGTTSGIAIALGGAETGATLGLIAGPPGAVCGAIAGAIITGLIGGAAGCTTGSFFGDILDEKVLNNFRCCACGHRFNQSGCAS